ncbi:hypothetical protein PMZ80_008220 [Knufia obscura]|uniref:Uncharacterized protein n=2 Tax=Knufia TaxID=430999 RepID=A0AAN8ERB5_9EURO|nr:hypothetical protein PMZ80_008220 [Knufia obscura]KAK5957053.1 hypothetical protein OHC33_001422 [Knufia fluminis]
MEPNQKINDLRPPQDDVLQPVTLVLAGKSIHAETVPSTPLYQMNQNVTIFSIPRNGSSSSVIFERVEHDTSDDKLEVESTNTSTPSPEQRNHHLCYLVHPTTARYRPDLDNPAYYITSMSSEMLGNIHFEPTKSSFPGSKTSFKALLSAQKSATDKPLFDQAPQSLFTVKPKWKGGRYMWTDTNGTQVAFEDGSAKARKLVITLPMQRHMRDSLVALWVLRIWHDVAESRQAKREVLESMTAPTALSAYPDGKSWKRVRALGAVAVGGGGGA